MKLKIEDSDLFAKQIAGELAEQLLKRHYSFSKQNEKQDCNFMLSTKDAALRLGVHVNTIRSWVKSKEIESLRFGNRIFVIFKEGKNGL